MADGHGGARTPTNPAAVSGPGSLSRRTDGKQPVMDLPNAGYGENAAFNAQESAAPMAQAGPPSVPPAGPPQQQGPVGHPPTPLTAGSLLPNQPVTHGADSGPGPDSSSLGLTDPNAGKYTSALQMIQGLASSPNASPAVQALATSLTGGY